VAELEGLVREAPLRERRWGQLMVALYRSGRQAEALGAYRRARDVLADELGVDPGPDLQRTHSAILQQDAELNAGPSMGAVRTDVCPYKGLARFERADAEFFFGREQLEADGIALLVGGGFLGLIGASGSGKSSLLRAGFLDALASGAIPGSGGWSFAIMRPGQHPLGSLRHAVAMVSGGHSEEAEDLLRSVAAPSGDGRFVIVIDQFEEVFTVCEDEVERRRFLDAITEASLTSDGRIVVLLAMRADHYGRCAEHRGLASLLATSQLLVGPMTADELRSVIELPAKRAGLSVQPELTEALIADVIGRPGGLPLLSTALLELWQRRRDGSLTLDAYVRSAGVNGAVARLAEQAFARLDPAEQAAARRILMRLAASGRGEEVVGRRASVGEFDLDHDASAAAAVAALANSRLVTVSDGAIEVAHEALFREWPRLRTWLDDDAEGRKLHHHVTGSAQGWEEGGRDGADLYRGARLTAAADWAGSHGSDLNELERSFLDASLSASEGEATRARRTNRRLRGLLAGVAALLLVSIIVGDLALSQRNEARAAADVADARQLAVRSREETDLRIALLLSREAVNIYDSPETRSALFASLQRAPSAITTMYGSPDLDRGDGSQWMTLSGDGRTLVAGSSGHVVQFFTTQDRQPTGIVTLDEGTRGGVFSPDGKELAIVTTAQRVVLVDMASRSVLASPPSLFPDPVTAIAFLPDGSGLVTAEKQREMAYLVLRDASTLRPLRPHVPAGSSVDAIAASEDRLLTTGSSSTQIWMWNDRRMVQLRSYSVTGDEIAVSPDGSSAALIRNRGVGSSAVADVSFVDLNSGDVRTTKGAYRGPGEFVGVANGIAFTPNSRMVLTTGNDGNVLVWDVASAAVREVLTSNEHLPVFGPAISPSGSIVFTLDPSGAVLVSNLAGDGGLVRPFVAGTGFVSFPFFASSPEGRTLAAMESDFSEGSVNLIDMSTLSRVGQIPIRRGFPEALAFSPVSRSLAVASFDSQRQLGRLSLWDTGTMSPEATALAGFARGVNPWAVAFTADGRSLAVGAAKGTAGRVYIVDAKDGRPTGAPFRYVDRVTQVFFAPDGSLVASTGTTGTIGHVLFLDPVRLTVEFQIVVDGGYVYWSDVSDDGRYLATADASGAVDVWDLTRGGVLVEALAGLTTTAYTVDISPDGTSVVATSDSGEVFMWDVATGTIIGRSFPGPEIGGTVAASFTPDGRAVVVVSETGSGWLWPVDHAGWESRACEIAGQSLTQAEWHLYLPDRPYHETCGS
jgi:WD40 repeat protein